MTPTNTECNSNRFLFGQVDRRQVVADFSGGQLTTDGGLILIAQVDEHYRISERLAMCFHDQREPDRVRHPVKDLLAQRLYGLVQGYEDINDHDELRHDPMFGVAIGKLESSYRAHLRSFGFYEKMLGSVYSKCHGLFKQSDRFRMGNHRASVVGGVASEEEDSSPGLELSRPDGRHLLSPQEWMQLGGLAQRFAPLLNGLLALQTVAGRRDA